MTNEENDLITRFIQRVSGAPAGGFAAPAAEPAQPLPPVDREADALIGQLFARYPEARYRITQTAFVQEHALVEAQNRIQRLEWELQQTRQAAEAAVAQAQASQAQPSAAWGQAAQPAQPQSRGFLGGLFGGRPAAPPPQAPAPHAPYQQAYAPPPPQYPAGYNPGLLQSGGPGFFGSALRTAAGVAGGVLAANALTNMFSGHQGYGGGFASPAQAGEFVPVAPGAGNPWAAPAADPYDAGGAAKQEDASGWVDPGQAPDPAADPSGGWVDPGTDDSSSGWTDAGTDDLSDLGGGGGGDWS